MKITTYYCDRCEEVTKESDLASIEMKVRFSHEQNYSNTRIRQDLCPNCFLRLGIDGNSKDISVTYQSILMEGK